MGHLWQKLMIALARSNRIKTFMRTNKSATKFATRFVGGINTNQAKECAETLARHGVKTSFFHLGEYVDTFSLVEENLSQILALITLLKDSDVEGHISVDPSQIGCSIDWDLGRQNAFKIAQSFQECLSNRVGLHCMMLDMEDHSFVQPTLDLYRSLCAENYPMAITLQAYLKRTEEDLRSVISAGGMVRLVKGAFPPETGITFENKRETRKNYKKLVDLMLSKEAQTTGFYPVFATHDVGLHDYVMKRAEANSWSKGSYEFEMLYGAKMKQTYNLLAKGERVRLYTPFGHDWWPYSIRRIGERPSNLLLLARGLF